MNYFNSIHLKFLSVLLNKIFKLQEFSFSLREKESQTKINQESFACMRKHAKCGNRFFQQLFFSPLLFLLSPLSSCDSFIHHLHHQSPMYHHLSSSSSCCCSKMKSVLSIVSALRFCWEYIKGASKAMTLDNKISRVPAGLLQQ